MIHRLYLFKLVHEIAGKRGGVIVEKMKLLGYNMIQSPIIA